MSIRAVRTVRVRPCTRARLPLVGAMLAVLLGAATARASDPQERVNPPRGSSCASFEASSLQAADPSSRLALAECYERHGRRASAWSQYRRAASAANQVGASELANLARERAKALEPDLSYLTVTTWKGQDVQVTRNGVPIDPAVLGTAMPLDPGRHTIRATAPGKRGWSKVIELGSHRDHVAVDVPVLPDDVLLLNSDLGATEGSLPAPMGGPDDETGGSLQRSMGLIVGALGIAGVATGTLFGVKAASDWSDAKALCAPYPYCGEEGASLAREAKEGALISTIGFATGLVGLSSGALLWFTAEARTPHTPALSLGVGRVMLRGRL